MKKITYLFVFQFIFFNCYSQWSWKALGPAPYYWKNNVSARVGSMTVSENYNGKGTPALFIAPEGGGIWRGTDIESHNPKWINITDAYSQKITDNILKVRIQNCRSLIVDPNHQNTLYAIAYSWVIKSQDGGNTWDTMPGVGEDVYINKVIVDPTDKTGNSIYCLALPNVLYRWNAALKSWEKTQNKGLSLNTINTIFDCDYTIYNNNFSLYLAIKNGQNVEIWKSNDKGDSWSFLPFSGQPEPNTLRGIDGSIYKPSDNIQYVLISAMHNIRQSGIAIAVYGYRNNGQPNPIPVLAEGTPRYFLLNIYSEYNNSLFPKYNQYAGLNDFNVMSYSYCFDWNSYQNQFYIGGMNEIKTSDLPNYAWKNISSGTNNVKPHEDNHCFAFYKDQVFVGNDGGVYEYNRSKGEWYSLNNSTLQTILPNSVSINPLVPDQLLIGTQDNAIGGYNMEDNKINGLGNDLKWTARTKGACSLISFVLGDIGKLYWNSAGEYIYTAGSVASGIDKKGDFIRRSKNGKDWSCLNTSDIAKQNAYVGEYPLMAINPNNPARLVVGVDRIYESFDHGDSWGNGAISPVLGTQKQSSAIAYTSNDQIWVAYGDTLYVQDNQNNTWNKMEISDGGVTTFSGHINSIVQNPVFPKVKYIATNNQIWRTQDNGLTWENITKNINLSIRKLICVKTHDKSLLFVGTNLGIYYCFDKLFAGACAEYQWHEFNNGLPYATVTDIDYNKLWDYMAVSFWGRGIYYVFLNDVFKSGALNTDDIPKADIIDYNTPISQCVPVHPVGKQCNFKLSLQLNKQQACDANSMVKSISWKVQAVYKGNLYKPLPFTTSGDNFNIFLIPPDIGTYYYINITATIILNNQQVINAEIPKFLVTNDTKLMYNMVQLQVQDDKGAYINYDSYLQNKYGYAYLKDCKGGIYGKADILLPNKKYRVTVQSPTDYEQVMTNYFGISFSSNIEYSCSPFDFKCINKVLPLGQPKQTGKKPGEWIDFISGPEGSGLKLKLNLETKDGCKTSIEMPYSVKQPAAGSDYPIATINDISTNSLDGCNNLYNIVGNNYKLSFGLNLRIPPCNALNLSTIMWRYVIYDKNMKLVSSAAYDSIKVTNPNFIFTPRYIHDFGYIGRVTATITFKDGSTVYTETPNIYLTYPEPYGGKYLMRIQQLEKSNNKYINYNILYNAKGQAVLAPNSQYRFTLMSPDEGLAKAKDLVSSYSYTIPSNCPPKDPLCGGNNATIGEKNKVPVSYSDPDNAWSHFKTGAAGSLLNITLSTNYKNNCLLSKVVPFIVQASTSKSSKEDQESMQLISGNNNINIIPNPNKGIFTITMPGTIINAQVEITDAAGTSILKRNINQMSDKIFNLSHYAKGIYYIKVNTGKYSSTNKVVVE